MRIRKAVGGEVGPRQCVDGIAGLGHIAVGHLLERILGGGVVDTHSDGVTSGVDGRRDDRPGHVLELVVYIGASGLVGVVEPMDRDGQRVAQIVQGSGDVRVHTSAIAIVAVNPGTELLCGDHLDARALFSGKIRDCRRREQVVGPVLGERHDLKVDCKTTAHSREGRGNDDGKTIHARVNVHASWLSLACTLLVVTLVVYQLG